jgi:hypothetical protein
MQWEARDYSEWQGAFKQEPSILSAAIEDAMKGAVPLAFAIQQSTECPLRVITCLPHRKQHCYSITASARASSVGGRSRPSAFAALRLIISSNLVGCNTGKSAGSAPLSTLPT